LSKKFTLKKETTGCTSLPILNFIFTGSKFTKFTHNVARSSQITFVNQNGDTVIRFEMPGWRIKVNSTIWPILTLKLVVMAMTLEPSENRVKLVK